MPLSLATQDKINRLYNNYYNHSSGFFIKNNDIFNKTVFLTAFCAFHSIGIALIRQYCPSIPYLSESIDEPVTSTSYTLLPSSTDVKNYLLPALALAMLYFGYVEHFKNALIEYDTIIRKLKVSYSTSSLQRNFNLSVESAIELYGLLHKRFEYIAKREEINTRLFSLIDCQHEQDVVRFFELLISCGITQAEIDEAFADIRIETRDTPEFDLVPPSHFTEKCQEHVKYQQAIYFMQSMCKKGGAIKNDGTEFLCKEVIQKISEFLPKNPPKPRNSCLLL